MTTVICRDRTFSDIQAVVFDKDGTLADSSAFLRSLAQRRARLIDAQVPGVQEPLLLAFGIEQARLNPEGLMAVGTREENAIAAAAYVAETGKSWLEAVSIVQSVFTEADHYLERKAPQTPFFEEVRELLERIASTGLRLCILSSDSSENVKDFVQYYELESYFSMMVGVDRPPGKPDPSLMAPILAEANVAPASVLLIGDSTVDIQLAHASNLAGCIAVTWGGTDGSRLKQADAIAHEVSDIILSA